MDVNELKKVVSRGEDSQHQFKEEIRNVDALAAEMVAFSNARGGQLLIGVSDQGAIPGLPSIQVDRLNQLISNAASQHVRSPITVRTENISVSIDRIVIVVTVPEGISKPYFDTGGVVWLKNGADKRRLNSKEELQRLFQEMELLHADEIPTRAGIEGLDVDLFAKFLKTEYREDLSKYVAEQRRLLENMNLACGKQLNLAGLLLFGERPQVYKPEFVIKAVAFPGTNITDRYLDSEDFEGPIPRIFQGALAFVMRHLKKIQNFKGVNSTGDPEIPRLVLEELLVNALVHRDYFITAPIRLFVFDNRIEIISPGTLPNHLTVEKVRAGNSIQRNPILASFAAKGLLPYRGLGTGVRRALQDWPQIEFTDDREGCLFTATIQRRTVPRYTADIGAFSLQDASLNAPLNDLQGQILAFFRRNSKASYDEVAVALSKDRTTVMRNIQKLKALGAVARVGSKKTGYWKVLD